MVPPRARDPFFGRFDSVDGDGGAPGLTVRCSRRRTRLSQSCRTLGDVLRLRDGDWDRALSDEGPEPVARLERRATARGGTNAERTFRCATWRVSVDEDSPKVLNLPAGREVGVCREAEATCPERDKLAALWGWDAVSVTVGTNGAAPVGAGPVGAGPVGAGAICAEAICAGAICAGAICTGPMGAEPICVKPICARPVGAGPVGAGPMGAKPIRAMLSAAIYKTVF